VKRKNGPQLGYLPRHSAEQIAIGMRREEIWAAFFRRAGRNPSTHQASGAIILLLNIQGAGATLEPVVAKAAK
jgi:hypothetical protein